MPCTPTALSHSYISQWATLTMLHQPASLDVPSLDPIPSPARGRGRVRRTRKDENDEDECELRCSPHPPMRAGLPAVRARTAVPRRAAPPPTLNFRRLAHQKPGQPDTKPPLQRIPSDVTNRPEPRTQTTPSPDLIFTMSPVLGLDGPSRAHRVPSRLSAEPARAPEPAQEASFLYSYTWDPPTADPPPPYSLASHTTSPDNDRTPSELLADGSSASVVLSQEELVVDTQECVVDHPVVPRLGRMHAKSDPLPARLSPTPGSLLEPGLKTQPIPIPKPSLRVPSDYGGLTSSLVSAPARDAPIFRLAKAPRARPVRRNENVPTQDPLEPQPEGQDVTGDWCGTADAVPAIVAPARRPPRKKRFFIAGVGESYDGDMDSEWSWRVR